MKKDFLKYVSGAIVGAASWTLLPSGYEYDYQQYDRDSKVWNTIETFDSPRQCFNGSSKYQESIRIVGNFMLELYVIESDDILSDAGKDKAKEELRESPRYEYMHRETRCERKIKSKKIIK